MNVLLFSVILWLGYTCAQAQQQWLRVGPGRPLYYKMSQALVLGALEEDNLGLEENRFWSNMLGSMGSFSMPSPSTTEAPTPDPELDSSIARLIWADAGGDENIEWYKDPTSYPWYSYEPCIEHPTYRYGSMEAYTAMAVALTKVFRDSRLTASILFDGMSVNSAAVIPMSGCGDLVTFSKNVLENASLGYVNETVREQLRDARLDAGFD